MPCEEIAKVWLSRLNVYTFLTSLSRLLLHSLYDHLKEALTIIFITDHSYVDDNVGHSRADKVLLLLALMQSYVSNIRRLCMH